MEKTQKYIHEDEVPYGDYSGVYPEDMMRKMRAKRIIAPNELHYFKNIGSQKCVAVAFWWAPSGDTDKINGKLELMPN